MRKLVNELDGTFVQEVEVESVLTPDMLAWCKKYDLNPVKGMTYDQAGLGGPYRGPLRSVKAFMQ